MIETAIFYLLAAVILIPAILVVSVRNVFHSALFLIVSLVGVGGMYAMLAADFVFTVQLLVYAGGVMVILLFVVLLSGKPSDWTGSQVNEKAWLAGLAALVVLAAVGATIYEWPFVAQLVEPKTTSTEIGKLFFGQMILPFEVVSLVLVAALVGAVYFSSKKRS
jgi:NADH-quinone oxidoreductase subunit J